MGIGGLILWIIMSLAVVISAWKVVRKLKGSPWFPLGFMIFFYALLLLLPFTFMGSQAYQDFVLNAYLWLLLGILFRLPKLALSAQFAADAPPTPSGNRWIR
jgi:DMSO/TMAO reductase YedYZ heme-binding membrane subunit